MRLHSIIGHPRPALVIALALVLAGCGGTSVAARPTATPTPTATATPTPTATATPTPTPSGSYAPPPSVYTVNPITTVNFPRTPLALNPTALTPDGKRVLAFAFQALPYPDPLKPVSVGWIDTATGHYTTIPLPGGIPANALGFSLSVDGAYGIISALPSNNAGGSPVNSQSIKMWAWNMASNATEVLTVTGLTRFGDHDLLIALDPTKGIETLNLDTNAVTPVAGTPSPSANTLQILAFTWPYLIYAVTPHGSSTLGVHANDLQTGVDVALPAVASALSGFPQTGTPQPPPLSSYVTVAAGSDTLFFMAFNASGGQLEELDHLMTSGATPTIVVQETSTLGGADAQVVMLLAAQSPFGCELYDRVSRVTYGLCVEDGPGFSYSLFNGGLFAVVKFLGGAASNMSDFVSPYETDIYAASQAPTQ